MEYYKHMMGISDILVSDTIIYVVSFLKTNDKIKFLSLSKDLHLLKDKIYFDELITYTKKINYLWYFDRFTNIIIYDITQKLPKSVKHITFGNYFNQDIRDYIPHSVTHLYFKDDFNKDIKGCIPNSVTHLI